LSTSRPRDRPGDRPGAAARTPWLVSMAMWSNCMQYVPEAGIPVRDLARRARLTTASMRLIVTRMGAWWGYLAVKPDPSRPRPSAAGRRAQHVWRPLAPLIEDRFIETANTTLGRLSKTGHVLLGPGPGGGRTRLARLTPRGRAAQQRYYVPQDAIERRWAERFGADRIRAVRDALERLVGAPAAPSPLLRGTEPYPDGWRASLPPPQTLPHYPLVLHRGGFPDGS
jgi:hypothetical protein